MGEVGTAVAPPFSVFEEWTKFRLSLRAHLSHRNADAHRVAPPEILFTLSFVGAT